MMLYGKKGELVSKIYNLTDWIICYMVYQFLFKRSSCLKTDPFELSY
jgi:hypothetical protein